MEFFNELEGGGVGPGSGILAAIGNPSADWTSYTYAAVVDASATGGITLQFNSTCGADPGCVADFTVDNVVINADIEGPTPPPISPRTSSIPTTSQWALIMLTMLLGLMVFANRKRLF